MAQQLVEAWRHRLLRRFPQFPHLVDVQVKKVWDMRLSKTLTSQDLADLESELVNQTKRGGRLQSTASAPTLQSANSVPPESRPPSAGSVAPSTRSASSFASRVRYNPRFAYPRQPLQKPLDIWDHLVRYDSEKYREAELSRPMQIRQAQSSYKKVLDAQMDETKFKNKLVIDERESDRQAMEIERKRYDDDLDCDREKRAKMRCRLAGEMLQSQKYRERQVEKEKKSAMETRQAVLDRESAQLIIEQEERTRKHTILQQRRSEKLCEFQSKQDGIALARERERREEIQVAERYIADLDAQEQRKKEVQQARCDRIKAITGGIGEANKNAAEEQAKADENRMLREIKKADAENESKRIQKEEYLLRCRKEVKETLDDQVRAKQQRFLQERSDMKKRGVELDRKTEQWREEEKAVAERRFLARRAQDTLVVDQILKCNTVHEEHQVRPELSSMEVDFNQTALRHMRNNGYDQLPELRPRGECKGFRDRKTVPSYAGSMSSDSDEDNDLESDA